MPTIEEILEGYEILDSVEIEISNCRNSKVTDTIVDSKDEEILMIFDNNYALFMSYQQYYPYQHLYKKK